MTPVSGDLPNLREIDAACIDHELQQRESAHHLDTEGRTQRTHVRVVGNGANPQNERVAKNGDINRRNAESIRVRPISDEVDGGLNRPLSFLPICNRTPRFSRYSGASTHGNLPRSRRLRANSRSNSSMR